MTVGNVAPTPEVSGPATAVRGQSRTYTFTASDPSPADMAAPFTYRVNWGDGTSDTVTGDGGGQGPGRGAGNDVQEARNATGAVLLGEGGHDTLYGGTGRTILIGGAGSDTLRAGRPMTS